MLRSLAQLIHELGYAGPILLFDEGDCMVSIGSAHIEKISCDSLREVIDRCAGESLPSSLFVYAVPPYFVTSIGSQSASWPITQQNTSIRTTRIKVWILKKYRRLGLSNTDSSENPSR